MPEARPTPWAPLLTRCKGDPDCWAAALHAGTLATGITAAGFDTITDEELADFLAAAHAYLDDNPATARDPRTSDGR